MDNKLYHYDPKAGHYHAKLELKPDAHSVLGFFNDELSVKIEDGIFIPLKDYIVKTYNQGNSFDIGGFDVGEDKTLWVVKVQTSEIPKGELVVFIGDEGSGDLFSLSPWFVPTHKRSYTFEECKKVQIALKEIWVYK